MKKAQKRKTAAEKLGGRGNHETIGVRKFCA